MRAQFIRGKDPKQSMEIGHFDPKTRKRFLSDICQDIMHDLQNLKKELNITGTIAPFFHFEGPVEEWKTEVDLRIENKFEMAETYFIMWDDEKYIAGVSGKRFVRSEHNNLPDAIAQIRNLL